MGVSPRERGWDWESLNDGVGHHEAYCEVLTSSATEGMQISQEQEVVPIVEGDAQSPQRTHPLTPHSPFPASSEFSQNTSATIVDLSSSIKVSQQRPR